MMRVAVIVLALVMSAGSQAAIFTFTDRGLTYSIDDTNPFVGKIQFEGFDVHAEAADLFVFQRWDGDGDPTTVVTKWTATVDPVSLSIPQTDWLALIVSGREGRPAGFPGPLEDIQFTGTYRVWTELLDGTPISEETGPWSWTTQVGIGNIPIIDLFNYPQSAPLSESYTDFVFQAQLFIDFPGVGSQSYVWGTDRSGHSFFAPVPSAAWLIAPAMGLLTPWIRRRKST